MNFRNKWKRFWTMDVHNHEGFTLVELIIVIAILAILSGVAVVGYSAYIKKANVAADKALVADVVNALTLAYYDGQLTESGYVVLHEGAAPQFSFNKDGVMEAELVLNTAYGDAAKVQLKWDGWTDTGLLLSNLEAMGEYADSINNSGYITEIGTEKVLQDVQYCATSFSEFVKAIQESGASNEAAVNMLKDKMDEEGKNIVDTLLTTAGYTAEDGYAGLTSDTLSNIVVFAVAAKVGGTTERQQATVTGFANGSYLQNVNTDSLLVDVANFYAAGEALVAYLDDPTCNEYFAGINMEGSSAIAIIQSMRNAFEGISTYITNQPNDSTVSKNYAKYYYDNSAGKTQAQIDGEAYAGIMATVNNLRDEYLKDADAITNGELFTQGGLLPRVDSFVLLASMVDELQGLVPNGKSAIVIVYSVKNGAFVCETVPVDVLG